MFDQLKMLKQARDLQNKLKDIVVEDEFRGISITINGKQEVQKIEIPDEMLADKENLEKCLRDAFNNIINKAQREIATKMRGDLGGLLGM
ncbi:YbaB/EbfC family nucleoid-associated protein [Patescibacteria group bacterium]|nr:YbaB/EbfC family nucleoid-associated protein [Patescibacteria group bacterium]